MQTPQERLTTMMDGIAGKLKLGDKIKCQASGPQIVVAPNAAGQPEIQVGWQLTLWLEHNRLIGQDPIGVTVGANGGTAQPPPALVEQIVKAMLEQAREIRAQANNPAIITPSANEMIENMRPLGKT